MGQATTDTHRRLRWLEPLGLLGALLLLLRALDVPRHLPGFVEWVRQAGLAGALSFAGVYVAAAVVLLPASVLTLGAGFVRGPLVGLAIVLPSATVAA